MDGHPIRGLIIMLLLIVINAVVAAAEEAFRNASEATVEHRAEEGDKRAMMLKKLLDTPHYYRNVIEIVVTAVSMLTGMLYAFSIYNTIKKLLAQAVFPQGGNVQWLVAFMVLVTIVIVYLMVLLGILVPKKLARHLSERTAYRLAPIIMVLYRLLFPIVFLLEKSSSLLLWLFGFRKEAAEENVTEEEIISIVNEGQEQGILEESEAEMISNIIEFDEKEVRDVMTHRTKMVAISVDTTIEEALEFMLKESYSRFPLYRESLDDIIGLLHLKDVIHYYKDEVLRKCSLADVARKPYFVPDTQSLDVLFHTMQTKKIHMAIAVDEYGQTAGLVAMEDILEEIVGDIQDEYDVEEELISQKSEDCFVVSGEISLEELEEETGIVIREEDMETFDTLNGLLISELDHIPQAQETFSIDYEGFRFDSVEVHDKLIACVQVTRLAVEETTEAETEGME